MYAYALVITRQLQGTPLARSAITAAAVSFESGPDPAAYPNPPELPAAPRMYVTVRRGTLVRAARSASAPQ
jgi:hypothetical protein